MKFEMRNENIIRKYDFDDEKSCSDEQCSVKCPINPNYKHKKKE